MSFLCVKGNFAALLIFFFFVCRLIDLVNRAKNTDNKRSR